jgi:hypothetical protein
VSEPPAAGAADAGGAAAGAAAWESAESLPPQLARRTKPSAAPRVRVERLITRDRIGWGPNRYTRTLTSVSTRKLILTALALGMAILIAGSVQLLRLSSSDSSAATVFKVGQSATVGNVVATLADVGADGLFNVEMRQPAGSGPLAFPEDRWSLQAGDAQFGAAPMRTDCVTAADSTDGVEQTCTLGFDVPDGVDGTRYLRFSQDGATATWVIEG